MIEDYSYYIADISETWQDFPEDGDPAVIVYFEGCSHNCPGCQNPENQKRNPGHRIKLEQLLETLADKCQKWKTYNVVFSGGDPFYHKTQEDLDAIMTLISVCEESGFKVCVYTGYEIEDIDDFYKSSIYASCLVKPLYLKTGVFIQSQYESSGQDKTGITLASKNQAFWKKKEEDRQEIYIPYSSGNRLDYPQD